MGLFGGTQKTQSTTVPWTGAQAGIKQVIGQGQSLYNKGVGFGATPFSTVAPMSGQTQHALSGMYGAAQAPNALAEQSMGAISGILGGATDQKYNDLYSQAGNPYFDQAVQNQADLTANDVQRQFGGLGRSGSAADTGALVDQIGRMRTQAMSDNWNQNIANQRGILGDQSQGQLGAVAAAPGAYQQQFLPYQMQAQVGAVYDQQRQRALDARAQRWTTNNQAPWNRLGALQSAVTGAGGGYNSTTQTSTPPSNPLGGALGGALGGGSMFGIPGAIGGGILGLLSGL